MRSPKEIVEYINHSAHDKERLPLDRLILLGVLGGAYIAMGGLLSVVIGYGFPAAAAGNPSVVRLLMGATFPVGLMMIILAGGELFTGCCAYFVPNIMNGRQSVRTALRFCTTVWLTNFVGALIFAYLIVYLPHISHDENTLSGIYAIAKAKTSNTFFATLLKGIGANWLVCLSVWLAASSRSTAGKILGIWFPVMTFVAIGYEHSVANMFFLPLAMFEGFELTVCELFTKNLIPATLGNILGGALFMGCAYWYIYDRAERRSA